MSYQGDFPVGTRVNIGFTTIASAGNPSALTGGSLGAFRTSSMTSFAPAGCVLSSGTGTYAGLNVAYIFTGSSSSFFVTGEDYTVVLLAGSVDAVNVANTAFGSFSLEKTGVNWNKITNATTSVALSATTVAGVTAPTGVNWANVINATTAVNLSATSIGGVPNVTTVHGNVIGSVIGDVQGNLDGNVGGDVQGSVASVTSVGANAIGSASLDTTALNAITDSGLTRNWTSVSGEAARSTLNALRAIRNKTSISGSTLTVTEEDDSTTAWTAAVTTTSAASITSVDPA